MHSVKIAAIGLEDHARSYAALFLTVSSQYDIIVQINQSIQKYPISSSAIGPV